MSCTEIVFKAIVQLLQGLEFIGGERDVLKLRDVQRDMGKVLQVGLLNTVWTFYKNLKRSLF